MHTDEYADYSLHSVSLNWETGRKITNSWIGKSIKNKAHFIFIGLCEDLKDSLPRN
jgi:hypothetical protein